MFPALELMFAVREHKFKPREHKFKDHKHKILYCPGYYFSTCLKKKLLSLGFEEVLHQLAAVGFKDAGGDGSLGMEGVRCEEVIAALIIRSTIDDTGYLGPPYRTSTHGTGLHSDIEGAVSEILATEGVGSSGDGLHLGMGGDIAEGLGQVMGTTDDAVLTNHDCSNGYLACLQRQMGLVEGHLHIAFVLFNLFFHTAKIRISE